jgi:hypothetical protein
MNEEASQLQGHAFGRLAEATSRSDAKSADLSVEAYCEAATRARVASSHQRVIRQRALVGQSGSGADNQALAQQCLLAMENSFRVLSEVWEMRLARLNVVEDQAAR